jgi:hypothetical protein
MTTGTNSGRVRFQNQRTAENGVASGDNFWTALAERSGDSAFDGTFQRRLVSKAASRFACRRSPKCLQANVILKHALGIGMLLTHANLAEQKHGFPRPGLG